MTLFDHLRELRGRLFKAALGVALGAILGLVVADHVFNFLIRPYCDFQHMHGQTQQTCLVSASGGPLDVFLLKLKVALYIGLLLSAPLWLYQLWAFIAPGLHKRERRFTYAFAAVAAPLFAAGVLLAHIIVTKTLHFFLGGNGLTVVSDVTAYFAFVTNMMLLFGAAFEFPLIIVMLNMTGLVSGRKLLGWWRPAIFLMFVFGAVVTPTPDPFSMSILASCMAILYFGAVAFALFNDRRKRRNRPFADVDDDEASPLDPNEAGDEIMAGSALYAPEPIDAPTPLERRYDDFT